MKLLTKSILASCLILLVTTIFPGCSDNDALQPAISTNNEQSKQIKKEEPKEPEHKVISIMEFFDTKVEDIDNKSSYDIPRIQFLFSPQENQKPQFWSVKINGTDLREIIPYKEFYAPERDATLISGTPKRSPNNRFIIMMRDRKSHAANIAMLYDLKTKRWEEISNLSGNMFYWLPDSSGFYMIENGFYHLYNMANKTLTKTNIPRGDLQLRPDGTIFSNGGGDTEHRYSIFSLEKGVINSFDLETSEKFTHLNFKALDIKEDVILYEKRHNNKRKHPPRYFLYDINKKEIINEIGQIYGNVLYMSSKRGYIYSFVSPTLYKYSLEKPTEEITMFDTRKSYESGNTTRVTIYNLGDLAYE